MPNPARRKLSVAYVPQICKDGMWNEILLPERTPLRQKRVLYGDYCEEMVSAGAYYTSNRISAVERRAYQTLP